MELYMPLGGWFSRDPEGFIASNYHFITLSMEEFLADPVRVAEIESVGHFIKETDFYPAPKNVPYIEKQGCEYMLRIIEWANEYRQEVDPGSSWELRTAVQTGDSWHILRPYISFEWEQTFYLQSCGHDDFFIELTDYYEDNLYEFFLSPTTDIRVMEEKTIGYYQLYL